MKSLLIAVLMLYVNLAFADDAWISCLNGHKAICVGNGDAYDIYVCNDWTGEDEACIRCTNGGIITRFAGCGSPEMVQLQNNRKGPTCLAKKPGFSTIHQNTRSFTEEIPLTGSDLRLVYSSNRGMGRVDSYRLRIPLFNSTPTTYSSVDTTIEIAGRTITNSLAVPTNTHLDWTWDGLDSASQPTSAGEMADVTLNYGGSLPITFSIPVGNWKVENIGLAGWSLSNNHFLDLASNKLYMGTGEIREVTPLELGSGEYGVTLDLDDKVFIFHPSGRHVRTLAGLTGSTIGTFTYDASGRLLTYKTAYNKVTNFYRDVSGNLTSIKTPYNVTTTIGLSSGRLVSVTNPASQAYAMTYTTSGILQTFTKPTGEVTTFNVDSDGNIVSDSHSGGAFISYLQNIYATHREFTSTSAEGRNETIKVLNNETNSTWHNIDSLGVTQKYYEEFGSTGSIKTTIDDIETNSQFTNDPRLADVAKKPQTVTENNGSLVRTTNYTYSASLSDPNDPFTIVSLGKSYSINGRNYTESYAPGTRRWTVSAPVSRTTVYGTNTYQYPNYLKIGSDTALSFNYNANGMLSSVVQGARTTSFGYNAQGFRSSVTNALTQATTYGYNSAGQVTSITTPDSRTTAFTYDATGRVKTITPPGKPAHNFYYNALELLQKYLPASLGGTPDPTEYFYNNDRQLTQVVRPDTTQVDYVYGSVTAVLEKIKVGSATFFDFTYHSTKGFIDSISSFDGLKNTYSYNGNLPSSDTLTNSSTSAQISKVTRTYNNNFWMTALELRGDSGSSPVSTSFGYDNGGMVTSTSEATYLYAANSYNNSKITIGSTVEDFGYNTFSERTSSIAKYSSTTLYSTTLTRDALGRVATLAETIGGVTTNYGYTYDVSGRLTLVTKNSVTDETFTYDNNNNITASTSGASSYTGTYDNQDRVLTFKGYTFGHNINGEITSKQNASTLATTTYAYNSLGYMTDVTLPSTDVISYSYDGQGRRVGRELNGTATNYFIYNGQYQIVGELNSLGGVETKYIYVSQGNSPDYMVRSGVTYKFIKNHLGSIRLVVNTSTGATVQRIDYDTYGKVVADTNPGLQPFGFAGGLYDAETGLVRFGARDYDAETGRWTSKDPSLFAGGLNLYGYTNNDPVNFIDSNGKNPVLIAVGAGAIVGGAASFTGTLLAGGSIKDGIASIPGGALAGAAATITTLGALAGGAVTGVAVGTGVVVDLLITAATAPDVLPPGAIQDFSNGINPPKRSCP